MTRHDLAKSRDIESLLRFGPIRLFPICGSQAGVFFCMAPRQSLQMSAGYIAKMGSFHLQTTRILYTSFLNLPEFLIPACRTAKKARPFSTSRPCAFRVGGAPVSLPPGVSLKVVEPPVRRKNIPTRREWVRLIEIEGPLGLQPSQ